MLKGKKVLLGVTGSIAAYKSAFLIRLLVKAGAKVRVVMTPASRDFISPLTLATLSKHEVLTGLFENDSWANHVMLGRWADIMLIAPLSCNTLSDMANGKCNNLLLAVYLSATCEVAVAPAMDEDMWLHPSTQNNLKKISSFGNHIIPVEEGELASGLYGKGRMAAPEGIVNWINSFFSRKQTLLGKTVLVTAGPTYEAIDPVRFVGNRSSGKMGFAIAEELKKRGAKVILVSGPVNISSPSGIDMVFVQSAAEMYEACINVFASCDAAIMAAAVADYRVKTPATEKIKKKDESLVLHLEKTTDILQYLCSVKKPHQIVVGFALETNDEEANALKKLKAKHADYIILNSLGDSGAGFGTDTNKITIFDKQGGRFVFDLKSKQEVSVDIINTIFPDA